MPFSNSFVISCRALSIGLILLAAFSLNIDTFSYRSIFVGLLFSHFALGAYYSRNNLLLMKDKKYALLIATVILLVGLYFSIYFTHLGPYFLVLHAALSDAYLLPLKSRLKDGEYMALLRSIFYCCCGGLIFIAVPMEMEIALLVAGGITFFVILFYTEDRRSLTLFELPLLAVLLYCQMNSVTFHFQFLGFYHILTWYVFSFWMLYVKEKNGKKTLSFFSMVAALSVAFIVLFDYVLGLTITDNSFFRIIGIWSILHIFSSIPLSKLNPRFLKNLFYAP